MSRFLKLSGALLASALLLTFFVWLMLQSVLQKNTPIPSGLSEEVGFSDASTSTADSSSADVDAVAPAAEIEISSEPIAAAPASSEAEESSDEDSAYVPVPLNTLNLSDSQKSLLDTAGVDPDTFVITAEMQTCAYAELGDTRIQEILAGDSPSLLEGIRLSACFR